MWPSCAIAMMAPLGDNRSCPAPDRRAVEMVMDNEMGKLAPLWRYERHVRQAIHRYVHNITESRHNDEILCAFGGHASATPNDEDGCSVLAQESRQNPVKRRDFVTRLFGWAAKST